MKRTITEINARIKECEAKYKEVSKDDFYKSDLITKQNTHHNVNMRIHSPYESIWTLGGKRVAITIPTDLHGLKPKRYFLTND